MRYGDSAGGVNQGNYTGKVYTGHEPVIPKSEEQKEINTGIGGDGENLNLFDDFNFSEKECLNAAKEYWTEEIGKTPDYKDYIGNNNQFYQDIASYNEKKHVLNFIEKELDDINNKENGYKMVSDTIEAYKEEYYSKETEPTRIDARNTGKVSKNFQISNEDELKNTAKSIGINMEEYDIAPSEDGTIHLRSKDGKTFLKTGTDPEKGISQVVITKIVNGKPETVVRPLPEKSLEELNARKAEIEKLAPPNEDNYSKLDRRQYVNDLQEWQKANHGGVDWLNAQTELKQIEKDIYSWNNLSDLLD